MTGTLVQPRKNDPAVAAFIKGLPPGVASQVRALRKAILAASPDIHEGIKWNVPSFRTTDWFATFNVRGTQVRLILHTGAKAKATKVAALRDEALLEWLAKDRCLVAFADAKDVKAKSPTLTRVIREWILLL